MAIESVSIIGSKSLDRYTMRILARGFELNNIPGTVMSGNLNAAALRNIATPALVQLHGAPQSEADDRMVLEALKDWPQVPTCLILHRPDELQDRYGGFKQTLDLLGKRDNFALSFFGDYHVNDPWFSGVQPERRNVLYHGFFELPADYQLQIDPIVIGTHTTLGEMRSKSSILALLGNIFRLNAGMERPIVGYLGGKPLEEVQIAKLKVEAKESVPKGVPVLFLDAADFTPQQALEFARNQNSHAILVSQNDEQTTGMTLNTQMYYRVTGSGRTVIRTGEASGTAHLEPAPVIFCEMNHADRHPIVPLQAIWAPYGNIGYFDSIDFPRTAEQIIDLIDDGQILPMMQHNLGLFSQFGPARLAQDYLGIFQELQ